MKDLGKTFQTEETDKGMKYDNSLIQRGTAARRERDRARNKGARQVPDHWS